MSHNIMQFQSTGSEVSKVESDISQTLSLADTIVTLVREPVALLYKNINKSKAIKRSIGKWEKEAFDADKECHIPVRNTSKGCWAYFLHALGIRPGMGIVEWKPAIDGYVDTQNGGIEMEIDGAALCHIMNLYRVRDNRSAGGDTPLLLSRDSKSCRFPFGKLAWDSTNGQVHAHFQPDSVKEIQSTKHPFGSVGKLIESNTLLASYFNALEIGVSDPSLSLPKPTTPLLQRVTKLLDCIDYIATRRYRETQGPLLITYEWLENAARIRRRALARGGKDHSFYNDICQNIDQHPRLWEDVKDSMKHNIRGCFMFDEDMVDFWIRGASMMSGGDSYNVEPDELIIETLEKYKDEPLRSWKHDIYSMRTDIARLATYSPRIYLHEKMWVLQFDRSSAFWNERVLLGAPIDG